MIPITKPVLSPKEEYEKYLDGIWTRNRLTSIGPLVSDLELKLENRLNVKPLLFFTNGTISLTIGLANIIYYNSIITHDVILGDLEEISPGAKLLRRCQIGNFTNVGANATILPAIKVRTNVQIGADDLLPKNSPHNCVAVGEHAKIIRFENT